MNVSEVRGRWKRALAWIGVGIALAGALTAAWLLPAPTKAADRIIAAEPDIQAVFIRSEEARWAAWIGPTAWDVRFLGSATNLATAGPRNPLTFRDLTGARPDWTLPGDWTDGGRLRPPNLVLPYAFSADGTLLAGRVGYGPRSLRIWEVAACRERVAVELASGSVNQLDFSADGKRLALGSGGQFCAGMTIVDAKTGAERASLRVDRRAAAATSGFLVAPMVVSAESQTL